MPRPTPASFRHLNHRPFASAELADGAWACLSQDGVAEVDAEGVRWERPWFEISRGQWDEDEHSLVIEWVDESPTTRWVTREEAPKGFAYAFREQVDASIIYSVSREQGRFTARAVVRRRPTGAFVQIWVNSPQVPQALVQQVEALAADAVGLPNEHRGSGQVHQVTV